MNLRRIFRKIIKITLPLALGVILLWYLYRNQDITEMKRVISQGVNYNIILLSLVFGLLANVVRGFRWSMLIDSLGKHVSRRNAIYAVLGNYAINMALPRVGEIWRCSVVAKYEKIPFAKLLGTLFVDRLMDTTVVGSLTLCLCIFNIGFFRKFFHDNPPVFIATLNDLLTSVWTYIALALFIVALWYIFVKLKHLSMVQKATALILNVWEGVRSLWKIEYKIRFIVETLMIWGGYFLYFYITFFAFDFTRDLGIRIALIAFAMSSIGVAVPVQGGIGVWHFMVISTLVAFGVNKTDAGAFAMVVFAVQTIWVVLTGLIAIAILPIINNKGKS
ncbi:MAG: flippase-like domain-containing protein [Tannerella sp.]|nr:flippase-like domain-containing protein [Tannerella sp.]